VHIPCQSSPVICAHSVVIVCPPSQHLPCPPSVQIPCQSLPVCPTAICPQTLACGDPGPPIGPGPIG
jgi:hypothetical protein